MLTPIKFLILTTTLFLSQCCQTQIKFRYSSCTFHVTYNDTACFNYIWSHCSWSGDGSHGGQSSDYNHCTNYCCQDGVTYPQNWDGIQQCQDYLNDVASLTFGIIFGMVGGIALIIGLIALCTVFNYDFQSCCYKIRNCVCCRKNQTDEEFFQKCLEHEKRNKRHLKQGIWISDQPNEKLKELCSICLQKGISLELECGHMFHRKCITTWIKRNGTCAICRSSQLSKIKVYCERCFSCYFQSTLYHEGEQVCRTCQ